MTSDESEENQFSKIAEQPETGLLWEFFLFLKQNKKWWLAPFLVVVLLFGALIAVTSSAAAPFIYSLW